MPVPVQVVEKLQASLDRFNSEAAKTANSAGADEVHDVRVSIRRLEQALELFGEWLPAKGVEKIGKRLTKILKMAGDVRDRDIAMELTEHLELEVHGSVRYVLQTDRDTAADRFSAALLKIGARQVVARWSSRLGLEHTTENAALPDLARSLLPPLAARFITSGSGLASHPTSRRRLHKFRISAKRFRYSLEFLSNLYGPAVDERIATVRKIQTALGDLQDCVATRRLLRDLEVPRQALIPLRNEEEKRLQAFVDLWPALFDTDAAAEWTRYLEGLPQGFAARTRPSEPSPNPAGKP